MIDDPEHEALRLARTLGVPQEARRLRSSILATEHLLMATLSDPIVRWRVKRAGVDMREVQERVSRASEARPPREEPGWAITSEAADVLVRVRAATAGLDPDRRPDPDLFSTTMASLMAVLLDEQDTTAHRILVELDLVRHADRIVDEAPGDAWPSTPPRPF